jgi:hypothetical protein
VESCCWRSNEWCGLVDIGFNGTWYVALNYLVLSFNFTESGRSPFSSLLLTLPSTPLPSRLPGRKRSRDFLPSSPIIASPDAEPSSSLKDKGKGKGNEKGIYLGRGLCLRSMNRITRAMPRVIDWEGKMSRWMGKTNFHHTKNTYSSRSISEEPYKIDGLPPLIGR